MTEFLAFVKSSAGKGRQMSKKKVAKPRSKATKKKTKKSGPIMGQSPAKLIALLDSWLKDESGYDERTWPILKKALERNRHLGERRLFHDTDRSPGQRSARNGNSSSAES
jgi:hypothetical protein